jgi:hypothetical protein
MSLARQWARLRRFWSGQPQPEHEQQLIQLYWNRAELKKELTNQQEQRHALSEKLRVQEAATRRAGEVQEQLHAYLGNPETGANALVYFQLRALWKLGSEQLAKFAAELRRQQEERERKRHQEESESRRSADLAVANERLLNAQSVAVTLQSRIQLLTSRRAELGRWWLLGLWNYSRRRELAKEISHLQVQWKTANAQVADLTDERTQIAASPLPEFPGLSVEGRRMVNSAALAYAEFQIALLPNRGLAPLAKDAINVQVFDIKFGSREECARLMALTKAGLQALGAGAQDLSMLKDLTDRLRARVQYRGAGDTVPTAESIPGPATATMTNAATEALDRKSSALNVLVDDYWGVGSTLTR